LRYEMFILLRQEILLSRNILLWHCMC